MAPQTCYWCGAPATSREHVPPKCIFPEFKDVISEIRFRDNLITVPSCEQHNLRKSKEDEYIMAVLAVNSDNNEVGVRQGTTKLVRAFQRSKGFVQAVIRDATPAYIHDESTGSISKTAAFSIDKPRLNLAFEHIGRGLYYHHFGTRFNGSINVFPEFLLEPGQAIVAESSHPQRALREASRESFGGSAKFGANQKVFFYQIAQGPSTSELIVRLVFYGGSCVLLVFREFVASSR